MKESPKKLSEMVQTESVSRLMFRLELVNIEFQEAMLPDSDETTDDLLKRMNVIYWALSVKPLSERIGYLLDIKNIRNRAAEIGDSNQAQLYDERMRYFRRSFLKDISDKYLNF